MSSDPELLHLVEARTAACITFDDVARLSDYLQWSGLYKLSEEADKICRWLDEVQDLLETKISEAEE